MRLNHILITVEDIEKVSDFFEQVIGLKKGFRPAFPFQGAWFYDEDDLPAIHLSKREVLQKSEYVDASSVLSNDTKDLNVGNLYNHVCFTQALEKRGAFIQNLDVKGVAKQTNHVPSRNIIQDFVFGPEGIVIEIQFE
ncbi:MAG: hypothetical protein ACWIPH_06350 [Ostreibacterium sp.]